MREPSEFKEPAHSCSACMESGSWAYLLSCGMEPETRENILSQVGNDVHSLKKLRAGNSLSRKIVDDKLIRLMRDIKNDLYAVQAVIPNPFAPYEPVYTEDDLSSPKKARDAAASWVTLLCFANLRSRQSYYTLASIDDANGKSFMHWISATLFGKCATRGSAGSRCFRPLAQMMQEGSWRPGPEPWVPTREAWIDAVAEKLMAAFSTHPRAQERCQSIKTMIQHAVYMVPEKAARDSLLLG